MTDVDTRIVRVDRLRRIRDLLIQCEPQPNSGGTGSVPNPNVHREWTSVAQMLNDWLAAPAALNSRAMKDAPVYCGHCGAAIKSAVTPCGVQTATHPWMYVSEQASPGAMVAAIADAFISHEDEHHAEPLVTPEQMQAATGGLVTRQELQDSITREHDTARSVLAALATIDARLDALANEVGLDGTLFDALTARLDALDDRMVLTEEECKSFEPLLSRPSQGEGQ